MAILNTRKIIEELRDILTANTDIDYVSTGALEPLASETNRAAVYISAENIAVEGTRLSTAASGYDRHILIDLYCNYDGSEDHLGVFDFIDSVERCILEDDTIWSSIVNRDLVAIDFDNQEHAPKRAITMLFDIHYRVDCS